MNEDNESRWTEAGSVSGRCTYFVPRHHVQTSFGAHALAIKWSQQLFLLEEGDQREYSHFLLSDVSTLRNISTNICIAIT